MSIQSAEKPGDGTPVSVEIPDDQSKGGESTFTVIIALIANGLLAAAKTFAGLVTGSASMMAESAHSWADTGNEIFLLIAEKQGKKEHARGAAKRDSRHRVRRHGGSTLCSTRRQRGA